MDAVAAALELPGRAQLLTAEPPLILDAAHNPDAARALAEALVQLAGERPVIACLAALADKDAAGIAGALAPRLAGAVATEIPAGLLARAARPGARALAAEELAAVLREAGLDWVGEAGTRPPRWHSHAPGLRSSAGWCSSPARTTCFPTRPASWSAPPRSKRITAPAPLTDYRSLSIG